MGEAGRGEHQAPEVGVGPWEGDLPTGEAAARYDPELLAGGDRRNVLDRYRYWSLEAVRDDLAARAHPVHVAAENLGHDLNLGSLVRTANAMGVAGVHVVGRRRWNRRGAMVTDRYLDVHHHPDAEALTAWASASGPGGGPLPIIGLDTGPGAVPLETYDLPEACVLLLGSEGEGLSAAARQRCAAVLEITQFGSTRSINVAAAGAIALHAWVRRHAFCQRPT